MKKIKWQFCFLLILLAGACAKKERNCSPAFYHWQTQLELSVFESRYLDSLKVEKLYVKFFDVDQSGQAEKTKPLATLDPSRFENPGLEIIPTVFITNRTLYALSEDELDLLSQRIYKKIVDLRSQFDESPLTEIQIDCDWTEQTEKTYFTLLHFLRKQLNDPSVLLSATIRLHQIKFWKKTGVPPVEKGMLMYYNMGEVTREETANSIIDRSIGEQYLDNLKTYPLALDVALPIFSWGVLFRDDKMIKLINNLDSSALQDSSRFVKAVENQYKVIKSTYLQGYYLYAGDRIRLEASAIETVEAAAKKFSDLLPDDDLTVSLYHLDTMTLKNYTFKELQAVYDQF